jgi:hypothetical protein
MLERRACLGLAEHMQASTGAYDEASSARGKFPRLPSKLRGEVHFSQARRRSGEPAIALPGPLCQPLAPRPSDGCSQLELGLKDFLIEKGCKPKELARKPYGHDLEQLYSEAQAAGLVLRFELVEYMLEQIHEWHNGPARVRYEFAEEKTLPMCEVVFPLVKEILRRTKEASPADKWVL